MLRTKMKLASSHFSNKTNRKKKKSSPQRQTVRFIFSISLFPNIDFVANFTCPSGAQESTYLFISTGLFGGFYKGSDSTL